MTRFALQQMLLKKHIYESKYEKRHSGEKSRISYCDKALRFALQQILLSHLLMVIYYGKDTVEKSQGYPTLRRFATNARYQFRCLVVSDCRSSFIFSIFYLT